MEKTLINVRSMLLGIEEEVSKTLSKEDYEDYCDARITVETYLRKAINKKESAQ